ncbi:hypothetical protein [Mycobacteroides chelonae]|uniref:hypothetical protein n=1 Tax=Mycobacteroides chelonae TaxID=1774 RepID=UPI001F1AAE15|nr:hypothetical protein [Mycobacteroides chelonae]
MRTSVSVSAVAMRYGLRRQTVLAAISSGRLPAEPIPIAGGRRVWLIDSSDAERLWGAKIPVS